MPAAKLWIALAGALALGTTTAHAADLTPVKIGISNSGSDVTIFIAQKRGYFREEGLDATTVGFDSGARMIPVLGTGELDVGAGSASAGLFNAVARGIKIQIVSGNGSAPPGYGHQILIVRKDHVDGGRYKTFADLKGMKVALPAAGVSATATINEALKKGGLSYKDIEPVYLGYPNHVIALSNGRIDAGLTTEPAATQAVQLGAAVKITTNDTYYPNADTSHILYSALFAERRPDAARKFMRAFIRAARFYNDALKGGKLAGPNAEEVIAILTEFTPLKDANIYRAISPQGCNPDGRLNLASLKTDFEFYASQGWIEGTVTPEQAVNTTFADAARGELGPYVPR